MREEAADFVPKMGQILYIFGTFLIYFPQIIAQFVAVILWVTCISLLRADVNLPKK